MKHVARDRIQEKNRGRWLGPLCLGIVSIGLVVAAILNAPLTWDGAYYLLNMIESGSPFIAHGRWATVLFHGPVSLATTITDSFPALRLVFSLAHVVTPLVALALCWWIVRKGRRDLFIWPMIALCLGLLPGQINFISEGIKADQLMWPLLLAIVVGLRREALVIAMVLTPVIWFLHPVSGPIFLACGAAALALAWKSLEHRRLLLSAGGFYLALGLIRFILVNSSYEQSEMTWGTQQRQWENGAAGLPSWSLAMASVMVVALFVPQLWSQRGSQLLAIVAAAAFIPMVLWAADPALWWEALEFRGPAFWITMLLAGLMVLHELLRERIQRDRTSDFGMAITVLAIGFSVVLIVQSVAWNRTVSGMTDLMADASNPCVPRDTLANMPESPLNLWTTNALSLVYQDQHPENIVMTGEQCRVNFTTGEIFIDPNWRAFASEKFDFTGINQRGTGQTVCYWTESEGWYPPEVLPPDRWRWTEQAGTVVITVPEDGTILLQGDLVSLTEPNLVDIIVNDVPVRPVMIEGQTYQMITGIELNVREGDNTITFRSRNLAGQPEGDSRQLAISLWNFGIRWGGDSTPCTYTAQD